MKEKEIFTVEYSEEDFEKIALAIGDLQMCVDNKIPITQEQLDLFLSFFNVKEKQQHVEVENSLWALRDEIMKRFGNDKHYNFSIKYKYRSNRFPIPNSKTAIFDDDLEIGYFDFYQMVSGLINSIWINHDQLIKNRKAADSKSMVANFAYDNISSQLKMYNATKELSYNKICILSGYICWKLGIAINPSIRNAIKEKKRLRNEYFFSLVNHLISKSKDKTN